MITKSNVETITQVVDKFKHQDAYRKSTLSLQILSSVADAKDAAIAEKVMTLLDQIHLILIGVVKARLIN